jgi:DUF1680 family protein
MHFPPALAFLASAMLACAAIEPLPFPADAQMPSTINHQPSTISIEPLPFRTPAQMPDAAELLSPAAVQLDGFLGARVAANAKNRLLKVDEEPLLAGFRKKPGSHPWIGEHVGKWMHAATLAWAYTGDTALRAKLDRVAAELVKAQEPDGYLGTYTPDKRFGLFPGADWDVWSHKYNLMGLLTYYQYTGNEPALDACRKIGDLLIATFGPGKKSILSAGTHVGMAATSVLEPIVLLYRLTADVRYLEFARYLVRSWDEPNGPKILQTLLTEKSVQKTANAKAYEMLSNLVGLCELARATGDRRYLQAALNAWTDVVEKRLYLTGSASQGEHFHGDYELPNQPAASVAETCVTTTWIQLNLQLLRLTGQARFGDQLERTLYNHLSAAQRPDGAQWCYFTSLEGKKSYGPGINCCVSSGPRGMALAPQSAYIKLHDNGSPGRLALPTGREALAASIFENSRVTATLAGVRVAVEQRSDWLEKGLTTFVFHLPQPAAFDFLVRAPQWTGPLKVQVNGDTVPAGLRNGWAALPPREWRDGDRVTVSFKLNFGLVLGGHGNTGLAALTYGPFVLAYDQNQNPGLPAPAAIGLVTQPGQPGTPASAGSTPATVALKSAADLTFTAQVRSARHPEPMTATFVPFANAGADGGSYRVWVRAPGAEFARNLSLLADGEESRSRPGNVEGSILDGDPGTFVVTFNAQPAKEDWFAVNLTAPASIGRVVFVHGKTFHDGGWFDASAGKPKVQIRREPGASWETVGELADYPATTAMEGSKVQPQQAFTLRLANPVKAVSLRVIGQPARGDNPKQAFASCAELEAFE